VTCVHVVTSCTDRKKRPVPEPLRLCQVYETSLQRRLRVWVQRLQAEHGSRTPARNLYGGEHWTEFLRILERGFRPGTAVQGWVISAGYGLIPVDAPVNSYSASFGRHVGDRVTPPGVAWTESEWWSGLAEWNGPSAGAPRTLAELGGRANGDLILLAASGSYLRAIEPDLRALFESKSEVLLFSASSGPRLSKFRTQVVPFDSRVREAVGGSQIAVNIRLLGHALREAHRVETNQLRRVVTELMDRLPPTEVPNRKPANDGELLEFIRDRLKRDSRYRPTTLLRQWRSQGRACEQGRFKELFARVTDGDKEEAKLEFRS
jgi:hypothetical protein